MHLPSLFFRIYTPFKTAINNGYLDVTKVFLEKGADAKAADRWRHSPALGCWKW